MDDTLDDSLQEAYALAQQAAEEAWTEATSDEQGELEAVEEEAREICGRYEERLRDLNAQLQADLAPLKDRLSAVRRAMQTKAGALEVALPCRPEVNVDVPNEDAWLFDSGRLYLEQMAAYKAHKKEGIEKKPLIKVCEECGVSYEVKRRDGKFCSRRCQDSARKKRNAPRTPRKPKG